VSNKAKQLKKEQLTRAMTVTMGNVSDACEQVGISRKTYYEYLKTDSDFKDAIDAISASTGDWVESKMRELIAGVKTVTASGDVYKLPPCKTSIIFYSKTKMKDRGYIERSEQQIDIGDDAIKKLSVEFIDGSNTKKS
jgi:hypothetical protein